MISRHVEYPRFAQHHVNTAKTKEAKPILTEVCSCAIVTAEEWSLFLPPMEGLFRHERSIEVTSIDRVLKHNIRACLLESLVFPDCQV